MSAADTSGLVRLHLIRHAPVDGPAGVIHGPDAPADLGNVARIAATRALLPASAALWSSPALRTRQTAQALLPERTPTLDARIAEQNFGTWTGRRHADLASEYGEAYVSFWADAAGNRPPLGESFADQTQRVATFLAGLPPGEHVATTHSGAIRAALAAAMSAAPASCLAFVIDPLSTTLLEGTSGGWRICWVNRLA